MRQTEEGKVEFGTGRLGEQGTHWQRQAEGTWWRDTGTGWESKVQVRQAESKKAWFKLDRQKTHKRHAEEGCENAEAEWESMVVQVGRGRFRRQRQADHRL